MRLRHQRWIGPLVGVSMLAAVSGVQANLITNGGFESSQFVDNVAHYVHLNGSELIGWTSFSTYKGTVLFNSLYDPVSEGNQAVQIEVGGDWISQSIATAIGETYTLTFDLSTYSGYGSSSSTLDVFVGSTSVSLNSTSAGYQHEALIFTADSAVTTLRFENSASAGAWWNYSQIDNVAVELNGPSPVPEPTSLPLVLLASGIGLAASATRRRR